MCSDFLEGTDLLKGSGNRKTDGREDWGVLRKFTFLAAQSYTFW